MGTDIHIIGIAGKARAGKDTVAELIRSLHIGVTIRPLAGPIKQACKDLLMVDEEYLQNHKEDHIEWANCSYRKLAQALGTDLVRDTLHEDFWVRRFDKSMSDLVCEVLVIPDIRFNNEAQWVKDQGGVIWEITRESAPGVAAHKSESGIDRELIDLHISNNGSIQELRTQLSNVVPKDFEGL